MPKQRLQFDHSNNNPNLTLISNCVWSGVGQDASLVLIAQRKFGGKQMAEIRQNSSDSLFPVTHRCTGSHGEYI